MDSETGLEESMWQLGLEPRETQYPERQGEPDCNYYLRTGTCGYGESCRFNHPRDLALMSGGGRSSATEYPERAGQPACQYFLKTGSCKYGSSCKYDHPKLDGGSQPISINSFGYPIRPGERECSYYVRTGQCKFGSTCKFNHPEPVSTQIPSLPPAYYPTVQAPTIANWQVARPNVFPAQYMQPTYGSMMISPAMVPVSGWNPYQQAQSSVQLSPSAPAFQGAYTTASSTVGPSSGNQKEHVFPERPGLSECQYYMRTGDCKFGPTCKYHHPPEWRMPRTDCALSPVGLPLRPGAQPCAFYMQHGVCKFGQTCKYDHPMGLLSYSPSASSLSDMPIAPYPVGYSMATLAPSSSSSDLYNSNKYSFSTQRVPLTESMPSGSIGSMFSKGGGDYPTST